MWVMVGGADVDELHDRAQNGAQGQDVDRDSGHVKDEERQDPSDSEDDC